MSPPARIAVATILMLALGSAADSCQEDEVSLLQVQKTLDFGKVRAKAPEAQAHSVDENVLADEDKIANEDEKLQDNKEEAAAKTEEEQYPSGAYAGYGNNAGQPNAGVGYGAVDMDSYTPGANGYGSVGVPQGSQVPQGSEVPPGVGSAKGAVANAANMDAMAERATQNAVWQSQQHEQALMFAAKRAAALRAAAEKAQYAENAAARSQINAADAMESAAVRKAATDRAHAQVAAWNANMQQASARAAAADATFAAQRAAATTAAVESAQDELHSMEEDSESADYQFNDRDSRKFTRHQYHDAMDNIAADRMRFRSVDEYADYMYPPVA